MNRKKIIFLMIAAITAQAVGAILNRIVVSLNGGMPSIGIPETLGKWVPLDQGTKLPALADIIRVGNFVLSIGDVFFFAGLITEMILLWIAIPQGRKFLPLLIASVAGIFIFITTPNNMTPIILCESSAVGTILLMYWSYRASNAKKPAVAIPVKKFDEQ